MSEEPVVHLQNVSKRFVFTPETPRTLLETIISVFSSRLGSRRKGELWAVKDINLDVYAGQCLGIVGQNGSGKSTVLKLIARILRPTDGRIVVRGRVSALLELGAGFHQDLTGRENIYLNASVLGLSQKVIDARFDDIVAFSELGDFIDMPVKHYSSGMYMRLGFSVAIHVEPKLLLVDEVLAVGDAAFQRKCIDQIYELKRKGTTIVLVSHNLDMVRRLASRIIWMEKGKVVQTGIADDVVGRYLAFSSSKRASSSERAQDRTPEKRWGSGEVKIDGVRFLNADGDECQAFETGDRLTVEMDYCARETVRDIEFALDIYRQDGLHISHPVGPAMDLDVGPGKIRCQIRELPLLPGRYLLTAAASHITSQTIVDHLETAYSFLVAGGSIRNQHGLVEFPATWEWVAQATEGISAAGMPE